MKTATKIELRLENFDKCYLVCDQDCQWGNLYDFSATLKGISAQKIQDQEQAKAEEKPAT